ncbi:hypothetical protein AALP_AA5G082800 [Arabis alpina]|uniref:Uncharacterized protein n=1 Tax=Arabis alpina TaxID=50452 RepID=A0A087GVP7_ARAAL|nr:hypothetical protein AALP_AA5G082800 [Arabis alpina]
MKTVTGGVIATKPISLPKAAKLLSGFVSSENGATQDVDAYLRRASVAFTELKSLHVELKETRVCSDVTHEHATDRVGKALGDVESIVSLKRK